MTTYVLIIITTFVGYNKGNVTVTTQEFNSLETCKVAGDVVLAQSGKAKYKTFCTKK